MVPCYNSEEYMRKCIESLLGANHPCEILVINDGSRDNTSAIAHEYADRYPQVIAVDQENANWGGVVNHGIELARGTYFKVVTLAMSVEVGDEPDLLITNYVYDHLRTSSQRVMQYRSFFPVGRVFDWSEVKFSKSGEVYQDKFIMIHAAWYKTQVLRESGVRLEEGVSYMDSMLLLHPMPFAKKLYYLDVAPYHYIIGREGQSVEIDVVKKHIDEQILASQLAIVDFDYSELYEREPNCAMLMTTIHLFMIGTDEALEKNRKLWAYLEEKNPWLYANLCDSMAGHTNRKTRFGRRVALLCYAIAQKVYRFA